MNRTSIKNTTHKIFHVYMLLFMGIGFYLTGAYILAPYGLSLFASMASFFTLMWVITTQTTLSFCTFSFTLGISHHPLFEYVSWLDESIIREALFLSFLMFGGLSIIAFTSPTYSTFAFRGSIYSIFSGVFWLTILNIFFGNSLFNLCLTYMSIVCFSMFVIIDIHSIIKDTNNGPVYHATQLLLDFVGILIDLIRLLKHSREKNLKKTTY